MSSFAREQPESASPPCLGDYQLLEEIARGGMGVVYRARQVSLNRIVAVKLILTGRFAEKSAVRRFKAEASAAAKLCHPNVVAIHEIGEDAGQHFFSMEYVEGQNLADFMRQQPISIRQTTQLLKKIAGAVHYAHEQEVIHRDLKPSNILIDRLLEPRITDFGLARDLKSDADLTITGQVLGSPNYISPEQADGSAAASAASDIYSLGAILYHLLTGRPPFAAETLTATLHQVITADPVLPRVLNPSVPRDLETICLKCLEKEPEKRYASAAALAAELNRFLNDEPVHARPIGARAKAWRWCQRKPVVAGLTAAFSISLFLGFTGVLWQWQRGERNLYFSTMRQVRDEIEQESIGRAKELLAKYYPKWWKKDLRGWEWYHAWNECQSDELFSLKHEFPIFSVAVSKDGTRLAAGGEGPVTLWDLDKKANVTNGFTQTVLCLTFSKDDKEIIGGTTDGRVIIWNLETQKKNTVLTNPGVGVRSLKLSPDGQFLAVYTHNGLTLWKAGTYERVASFPFTAGSDNLPGGIAFSPDSRLLAYSREGGEIVLCDAAKTNEAAIFHGHEQNVTGLAFSEDGSILISGSRDRTVRIWEVKSGRAVKTIGGFVAFVTGLSLSPDGRTLAVVGAGQCIRLFETVFWQEVKRLKGLVGTSRSVTFSPDAEKIFSAARDGKVRAWLASTAANSLSQRLPHGHAAMGLLPKAGIYIEYTNRTYAFWDTKAPYETPPRPFPVPDAGLSTMSPDGTLWATAGTNGVKLFDHLTHRLALDLPGGGRLSWDGWPDSTKGGVNVGTRPLAFSGDGRRLAFCGDDNVCRIWKISSPKLSGTRGGSLIGHFELTNNNLWSMKFSRKGRLLALVYMKPETAEVWNIASSNRVELKIDHANLCDVTISEDEAIAATAGGGGELAVWDLSNGQLIAALGGQLGTLWFVEFSPDDTRIAACGGDGTVRIWDRKTLQEVAVLKLHNERLWQLAFSENGETLRVLGQDSSGGLRIFTLRAPKAIGL